VSGGGGLFVLAAYQCDEQNQDRRSARKLTPRARTYAFMPRYRLASNAEQHRTILWSGTDEARSESIRHRNLT
jgi:hypothetical protein